MRKTFHIINVVLYLMFSVGLSFNIHYCGGKASGISIYESPVSCCCPAKIIKNSCCKNKSFNLQIDDFQQASSLNENHLTNTYDLHFIDHPHIPNISDNRGLHSKGIANSPPIISKDIYLLNSSLLFYA